jgi:DNA invertase Pin-like site-specific DNA recombinase
MFIISSMGQPVAYLRKSKVTSKRHVSWEVQEQEVRALAAQHGDAEPLLLSDWSRSGRGSKTRFRADYLRLKSMIAAGQVSVLYSYSLSRLARSLKEYVDLAELCQAHAVTIRLAREGSLDYSTTAGRLLVHVLAAAAQAEAEWGGERSADSVRVRLDRGDYIGIPPYGTKRVDGKLITNPDEPIALIIDAFEAAGSCYGAARLLNAAGSRTRRGAMWSSKVIGDVLEREGVTYRRRPRPGVKAKADWALYRLLICPCGNVMTAMDKRSPRYTCYKARHVPDHPKPFGISESKLMPWIRAEAAHLRTPDPIEMTQRDEHKRESLTNRRARILDNYEDGHIDRGQRDVKLGLVDEALERLDRRTEVVAVPTLDWTWPPAQLNAVLRAMWSHVQLDELLRPSCAVWLVPEWRDGR